ncbi:MAG: hypothetical protein IJW22_02825 [Clostridia bacterium]|nr:hypothetical protein [Clostridia bacterium]
MKTFARLLALLLALLTCLALIVACDTAGGGSGDDDDEDSNLIDDAYDVNGRLKDNLPSDLNYEGEEVTVLYWSDVENPEFEQETVTGDNVRDAIYDRNNQIEDRLNVDIKWVGVPGNGYEVRNFVAHVDSVYRADTQDYDLIASYAPTQGALAVQGYLYNLATLQNSYVDLKMPWWPQQLVDTVSFGDAYYFISGDMSTNVLYMMHLIYINKDLFSQYQLELPYKMVREGTWTLDEMIELTTGRYRDADNDNVQSTKDYFGFQAMDYVAESFFFGCNMHLVDDDVDEMLVISPDVGSSKTVKLVNKLGKWAATDDVWISTQVLTGLDFNSTHHPKQQASIEGRVLMTLQHTCVGAKNFSNSDWSVGCVPVPKYDLKQQNYYTGMGNPWTIYGIFVDFDDRGDRAATLTVLSAVMECWASEGFRLTTPEIFEVNFQLKYSEGQDETDMYEIVRSGITFDLGKIFAAELTNMATRCSQAIITNSSWSSTYKAYERSIRTSLAQIVENFRSYQAQRDQEK